VETLGRKTCCILLDNLLDIYVDLQGVLLEMHRLAGEDGFSIIPLEAADKMLSPCLRIP